MITKRKTQSTHLKSKQKVKYPKQQKQVKKAKKNLNQGIKPSASKKMLKPIYQPKQMFQQNYQQNQNQNRSNLPLNLYSNTQDVKAKQNICVRHEQQFFCMRRSASAGGIKPVKHVRKSLSPVVNKQTKDKTDIKHKYSSKPSTRSQKEKIKQPALVIKQKPKVIVQKKKISNQEQISEKPKMVRKKSEKIIKNYSQRLKTQNSSKMPQKQQKTDRIVQKKKNKKTNAPTMKHSGSKSKITTEKLKHRQKSSIVFSDVSFHDTSPLYSAIIPQQNFYLKIQKNEQAYQNKIIRACIIIQKHFRGYLTRKYIQQSKYMIYCIIKIQKVWRGYICRKKLKKDTLGKKNLSIQNSLITIKDFSQQPRQQRLKNKAFNFKFQVYNSSQKKFSQKEQLTSTFKKQQKEDEQKYINILKSLLQEEGLQQKFKQKIRTTLGKQKYVQNKIISEIISEKSFNSPRSIQSPRATIIMNSPSSWSKSKPQIFQSCSSPRNCQLTQSISKRINSPNQNKSTINLNSSRKITQIKTEVKIQAQALQPFQTSFEFIQQFQLKFVDYLRDNCDIKQLFLDICKKCQHFRTFLVMSQWNLDKKYDIQYFNFLQEEICPDIFPTNFRKQFLNQSSMKIYLQDNNFTQSLWSANKGQAQIYESYIKFIFDSFAQAIYHNYRKQIITKKVKGQICHYDGHELFKMIFTNSLTLMQQWSVYMCGADIPVSESEPSYTLYRQKNNQRLDIMINNDLISKQFKDHEAISFWSELALTDAIFNDLLGEACKQFLM